MNGEVIDMDCGKVGELIRRLRLEQGMTQRQLADRLNLSDKTVSKWERGQGCPDVTLLGELSEILGVELTRMLAGDLAPNEMDGGNMKKAKYCVCPVCGGFTVSTGGAEISCCGRRLKSMEPVKAAPEQKLTVEAVEDEWFVTSDHPMEKDNYIPFVAYASGGRLELHRLYPEWNLEIRILRRGHGMLIWHTPEDGLLYQLI